MTRSRTSIGDWLRSWRELGDAATPEDGRSLVELLQLQPLTGPAPANLDSTAAAPRFVPESEPYVEPPRVPGVSEPTAPRISTGSVSIESLEKRSVPPIAAAPSTMLSPATFELPRRELQPLFRRAVTRNLISAAAATWRREGAIAIKTLVDEVARGKPIRTLPRRLVPTVRVGAVLLVDRTTAEPFAADLLDLRQQLRRIAGSASVAEWWIADDLTRTPRQPHAAPWPPAPGTPVIVVATKIDRLAPLAADLARSSCPLIAIVPGQRVSARVHNVTVIGWDHRTRVSDVVRARRQADRR